MDKLTEIRLATLKEQLKDRKSFTIVLFGLVCFLSLIVAVGAWMLFRGESISDPSERGLLYIAIAIVFHRLLETSEVSTNG